MLERHEDKRREVRFVDLEGLVPADHLLRKIKKVIAFDKRYKSFAATCTGTSKIACICLGQYKCKQTTFVTQRENSRNEMQKNP